MLKNILNLEGVEKLEKSQQKVILGGFGCQMFGARCCYVVYYGGEPISCERNGTCVNGLFCR